MTSRQTLRIDANNWWRLPREIRFLVGGAYNTAFGYLLFVVAFVLLRSRVNYLGIVLLCYPVSVTSAFLVHRNLVFKSQEPWPQSFLRFNLSQLVAFLFGVVGLYLLVDFAHVGPLLAQAFIVTASVLVTYLLHRYFSFRKRSDIDEVP